MIGVIDYGAGNLKSVANALDRCSCAYSVCSAPRDLDKVDALILPGVGQFAAAMRRLRQTGLDGALTGWARAGKPIAGICLGLHLLFESSEEAPEEPGLGLIPGRVTRLVAATVPHIGWNRLVTVGPAEWLGDANGSHFYFAHSYVADAPTAKLVLATTEVDDRDIPAVIQRESIRAVQFHPEKSAVAGASLLRRMITW
jgi:imidazole glycerol phosphate synthase glutamine amidotransferase subunit